MKQYFTFDHSTKLVRILLQLFIFIIVWQFVIRIIFFYSGYQEVFQNYSLTTHLLAFLHGVRFDASLLVRLFPFTLFLLIPLPFFVGKKFWGVFCVLFFCSFSYFSFLESINIGYFSRTGTILSLEWWESHRNFAVTFEVIEQEVGWFFWPALFVFLLLHGFLTYFALYKPCLYCVGRKKSVSLVDVLLVPVFILLLLIIARGGIQLRPIGSIEAYFKDKFVAYLIVPASFSVLENIAVDFDRGINLSLKKSRLKNPGYFSEEKANSIAKSMLANSEDTQLGSSPFYRTYKPTSLPSPLKQAAKNIIVLSLESLPMAILNAKFQGKLLMPFLHALEQQSLSFTRFYAAGFRSIQGFSASLLSVPSIDNYSYTTQEFRNRRKPSFIELLNQNGFFTSMQVQTHYDSFRLHSQAKLIKFQQVISQNETNLPKAAYSSWGVWDYLSMPDISNRISGVDGRFFVWYISLDTHPPYALPQVDFVSRLRDDYSGLSDMLLSYVYLDRVLENFFHSIQTQEWYQDTVIAITADHSYSQVISELVRLKSIEKPPSRLDYLRIPLLFVSPENTHFEALRISDRVGSQLDLAATILDMLQIENSGNFLSYGKSLFRKNAEDFTWSDSMNIFFNAHRRYLVNPMKGKLEVLDSQGEYSTELIYKDTHAFRGFYQAVIDSLVD